MAIEIPDRERYEQAAEWLLKVQAEGAPPEAFAEMLAWCDADPMNKVAMERIEEAWAVTGEVETGERLFFREMDRVRPRWKKSLSLVLAAAASIVLALGIAFFGFEGGSEPSTKSPGERVVTAKRRRCPMAPAWSSAASRRCRSCTRPRSA
jgi:ferric-dicitrate binding protein FerR (iron transport regulator)